MLVAKGDSLGKQKIAHDIRVAKVPTAAQYTDAVDDPVAGQISVWRDMAQRPADHPRRARLTERSGNSALGRHLTARYASDHGIDAFRKWHRVNVAHDGSIHSLLGREPER